MSYMFGVERLCSLTTLTWDSTLAGASENGEGRFDSFPQFAQLWPGLGCQHIYYMEFISHDNISTQVNR